MAMIAMVCHLIPFEWWTIIIFKVFTIFALHIDVYIETETRVGIALQPARHATLSVPTAFAHKIRIDWSIT